MTALADTLGELVDAMLSHPPDGFDQQLYHLVRSDVIEHEKTAECICGPTHVQIRVGEAAGSVYLHRPLLP